MNNADEESINNLNHNKNLADTLSKFNTDNINSNFCFFDNDSDVIMSELKEDDISVPIMEHEDNMNMNMNINEIDLYDDMHIHDNWSSFVEMNEINKNELEPSMYKTIKK